MFPYTFFPPEEKPRLTPGMGMGGGNNKSSQIIKKHFKKKILKHIAYFVYFVYSRYFIYISYSHIYIHLFIYYLIDSQPSSCFYQFLLICKYYNNNFFNKNINFPQHIISDFRVHISLDLVFSF